MILGLYTFLLGISIVLILIGFFRPNESGFALIGFTLLFVLSLIMMNGQLEIENGANVSTTFNYDGSQITSSGQTISYEYSSWDNDTSHQIGFWLTIAAVIGFIFMLFSINRGGKDE